MSDIISSGLDGPAENIFRVTHIDRDSGRNSGHHFSDLQEEEEGAEGGGKGRKDDAGVADDEVIDDVILSDLARKAMEEESADHPVTLPHGVNVEEHAVGTEERSRGGLIDIKA